MIPFMASHGTLCDYSTGEALCPASADEARASLASARFDGGAGVILVDERGDLLQPHDEGAALARRCYVEGAS